MIIRTLLVFMLVTSLSTKTICSSTSVPIGVILDESSDDVKLALEHVIEYNNLNDSHSRITLNASYVRVDMADSFKLSAAICDQLDNGVFLLFGSSNPNSFNTIQSYSHALHVPYVMYSPNRNSPRDGYHYDISLSPSYTEAIIDIIKFYGWKKIYYLFDSDDGLWQLQQLYEAFRRPSWSIAVDARRLRDINRSHDLLRRLDRSELTDKKRIVLSLSDVSAYQNFFNQVVDVGMNRENYHYVVGGPDIDRLQLKSFLHGGVNITGFKLIRHGTGSLTPATSPTRAPVRHNVTSRIIPKPLSFRASTESALAADGIQVLSKALNRLLNSDSHRHIFRTFRRGKVFNNETQGVKCRAEPLTPWVHGAVIRDFIKKVRPSGLTGKVAFDADGVRKGHIFDVMQMEYKLPLKKIGTWSQSTRFTTNLTGPGGERKTRPANRTRIVTTILQKPFLEKCPIDGTPCTGPERFQGYCVDLARMVAAIVKYEYIIKLVSDNIYGLRNESGAWTGMIGELVREEADIAIAPLTISQMRERVVDFSKPFMNTGISIMIKRPDKLKPGVFSFMNPLSNMVWLCITFAFLAVSVVLFLVGRFSPYEWDVEDTGQGQNTFDMCNTLWFALGALMRRGSDVSPRSLSGRIVGSAWWFFTLILISSYTANLAAFLTIERMVIPIDSADDLVKQTEIKYGVVGTGSTYEFFQDSEVTVYHEMWNTMKDAVPSVFVGTMDEGVKRVRTSKGKYAFLMESALNAYYNQRKPCNTMKVGDNLDSKGYGIATPLGSDLRDAINIAVLELREVGELHKLEQKWWYDKGECGTDGAKDTSTSALTLSNVSGIFHILIGGLVLAIIVAFLVFLFKMKCKKQQSFEPTTSLARTRQGRQPFQRAGPAFGFPGENGACTFPSTERQLITFDSQIEPSVISS